MKRSRFLVLLWFSACTSACNQMKGPSMSQDPPANPPRAHLKKVLSPVQYQVACEGSTEPPFKNPYWNHKEPGIYVDVISGKPLFSSLDKFDSGTGWPSFTKPIDAQEIIKKEDHSLGMSRVEVRSKTGDAHLGHVFNDGPKEKGGLRFCINSASLRFVHKVDLEKEGYGEYKSLFK